MPHIHEKIDFTATAYIVNNNHVLLHEHKKYKIWIGVGGHIELDEEANQAIIREAKEESGLDITLLDPHKTNIPLKDYRGTLRSLIAPAFLNIHNVDENHQHVDLIYLATSESDKLMPEEEGGVLKWFTEEDLDSGKYPLAESVVFYAKEALKCANGL